MSKSHLLAFEAHTVWQIFKSTSRKVGEFSSGRSPQADAEYLRDCGLAPHSERAEVALAVRRVVAKLGKVDPSMIHAGDRFPEDLGVLPFWDSIDFLHFMLSIEAELGCKILGPPSEFVPRGVPVTVALLARRVSETRG